jgi:hypothetical protein
MPRAQMRENSFAWRNEFEPEIVGVVFRLRDPPFLDLVPREEMHVRADPDSRKDSSDSFFHRCLSVAV